MKTKKELLIIGAGSVGGHLAINLSDYSAEYEILGFLDDDRNKIGKKFVGFPVLGNIDSIRDYGKSVHIAVGIAFPSIKSKIIKNLKKQGFHNYPNFISKNAWISELVKIGEGCIIYPGTSVNYNSILKDFVVINMNCALGHDCTLEDYVSLAPGVSLGGNIDIGPLTEIGIGVQSLQGIVIGKWSTVGAGAVVIKDVPDGATVVGNPGRVIKLKHSL